MQTTISLIHFVIYKFTMAQTFLSVEVTVVAWAISRTVSHSTESRNEGVHLTNGKLARREAGGGAVEHARDVGAELGKPGQRDGAGGGLGRRRADA